MTCSDMYMTQRSAVKALNSTWLRQRAVFSWSGRRSCAVAPTAVRVLSPWGAEPRCWNSSCRGLAPVPAPGPPKGAPSCPVAQWLRQSPRPAGQRRAGIRRRRGSNPAAWDAVPPRCWRGGSGTSWPPPPQSCMWGDWDWEEGVGAAPRDAGGPGNDAVPGDGWGRYPVTRGPEVAEGTRCPHEKQQPALRNLLHQTASGGWTRGVRTDSAEMVPQLQTVAQPPLNSCTGYMGVPGDRLFPVSAISLSCSGTTPGTQQVHVKKQSVRTGHARFIKIRPGRRK